MKGGREILYPLFIYYDVLIIKIMKDSKFLLGWPLVIIICLLLLWKILHGSALKL
jgi:hypothetical protein